MVNKADSIDTHNEADISVTSYMLDAVRHGQGCQLFPKPWREIWCEEELSQASPQQVPTSARIEFSKTPASLQHWKKSLDLSLVAFDNKSPEGYGKLPE